MREGDFERAWRVADDQIARRPPGATCWHLPRHEQWIWNGAPLDDARVLVRCYHGLGDTLQFARFLPELRARASQTTVWVQPFLAPLLATMADIGRLLPLHDGDPCVDYDVDIEIMELAHALRVTPQVLPGRIPYLHVPPGSRPSKQFSVGVVTQAGKWDEERSILPSQLDLGVEGVALFSLQLAPPLPGMRDASTPDPLLLAARVQAMDLVITVDTMLAHLAGALGVRTWVLLPFDADWRWLTDRTDSPWYPTVRLWRQPRPGDWRSVLDAVRVELSTCARCG
ncbi:MAG: hypothetical protein JO352_03415 [Chloroflexi bacterium]|nr:hypothetical protein [Chloroflexota bacterium]MBV9597939.1 hypothetical protein [Chloroflexota bacterium]